MYHQVRRSSVFGGGTRWNTVITVQGTLIQWARWARAQGPELQGAPERLMCSNAFPLQMTTTSLDDVCLFLY